MAGSASGLAKRLRQAALLTAAALLGLALSEAAYRAALWVRARLAQDAGAFEIFAVGGSTTLGQPFENKVSFPLIAAGLFEGRLQGRPIVVRNLAAYGEDSTYPQWVRLRREAAFRRKSVPGAVLIYCGHNEGDLRPAPPSLRSRLWAAWERRVVDPSYLLTDLLYLARKARLCGRERTPDSLGSYLRRMAQVCRDAGLVPVFSTLASNIADVEPNLAWHPRPEEGEPTVAAGRELERSGRWRQALGLYAAARGRQPWLDPLLDYRSGRCLRALGRYDEAREAFWKAVDSDSRIRFGRATRSQNAAVRQAAAESGAGLADAAAAFQADSPHGLVGRQLFLDFHHPNLRGQLLIARAFAVELGRLLGAAPRTDRWRTEGDLRRAFAIDDQDMAQAWSETGKMLLQFACAGTPWPEDRLALARRNFAEAVRLQPGWWKGRLGLAIVAAAERTALLRDEDAMAGLLSLYYGGPPSAAAARQALAPLRGAVPDAELDALLDDAQARP